MIKRHAAGGSDKYRRIFLCEVLGGHSVRAGKWRQASNTVVATVVHGHHCATKKEENVLLSMADQKLPNFMLL